MGQLKLRQALAATGEERKIVNGEEKEEIRGEKQRATSCSSGCPSIVIQPYSTRPLAEDSQNKNSSLLFLVTELIN